MVNLKVHQEENEHHWNDVAMLLESEGLNVLCNNTADFTMLHEVTK